MPILGRLANLRRGVPDAPTAESVARGGAWLTIQQISSQIVSAGVFVLLGRLLVPAEFGLVASAEVVILLLRVFVDAGFSTGLIQRRTVTEKDTSTAFWTSLALGAVLAAGIFICAPLLANVFQLPRLVPVFRALSPLFILAGLESTPSALLDRSLNFKAQSVRRFVAIVLSSLVAVIVAVLGGGVWALVVQALVTDMILVVLLWSFSDWRPTRAFSLSSFGELSSFGSKYLGVRLLWYMRSNVDNLLIAAVLGPVALGVYVIGYRVFIVFNEIIGQTINRVALPVLASSQDDAVRLRELTARIAFIGGLVGFPIFAGLGAIAPDLIPGLFGTQWRGSVRVMQALTVVGLAETTLLATSSVMVAVGKSGNELRWTIFSTLTSVAGFIVTVKYGVTAVSISLAIVTVMQVPFRIRYVSKVVKIRGADLARALSGPFVAAVCMTLAVAAVHVPLRSVSIPMLLITEIVVGAVTYAVSLRLFSHQSWRQAVELLNLLISPRRMTLWPIFGFIGRNARRR